MDELQRAQQELSRVKRELEDTNRGVVALYAELDEQAEHLLRADGLKSRFLWNTTHEFRTPVNSIIGLCNLLRDDRRRSGCEPEPEIDFILEAANQLSTLVNDLLDLAKIDAGKTVVRPSTFEVQHLFAALRGMFRPLLLTGTVTLAFDDVSGLAPIHTDEAGVARILRNLISNGLKFTERGEVRVSASADHAAASSRFESRTPGIHRDGQPGHHFRGVRTDRASPPANGPGHRPGASAVAPSRGTARRIGGRRQQAGRRLGLFSHPAGALR